MTRMEKRIELHELLCELLGSSNVYFQPPESVKIKYPAIVYELAQIRNSLANNQVYMQNYAYTITAIAKDPDTDLYEKISKLPKCRFDRSFVSDNLNHYVFTIFY